MVRPLNGFTSGLVLNLFLLIKKGDLVRDGDGAGTSFVFSSTTMGGCTRTDCTKVGGRTTAGGCKKVDCTTMGCCIDSTMIRCFTLGLRCTRGITLGDGRGEAIYNLSNFLFISQYLLHLVLRTLIASRADFNTIFGNIENPRGKQ